MNELKPAEGRHHDLLWMLAAGPRMLAGLTVLVWLSGPCGRFACVPPLAWMLLAGVWATPAGERMAVRIAYTCRQPRRDDAARLQAAFTLALSRTKVGASEADLYVRRGAAELNAYAAGRRSIAVSEGLAAAVEHGQLAMAQVSALLTHDLLTAPVTCKRSMSLLSLARAAQGTRGRGRRLRRFEVLCVVI